MNSHRESNQRNNLWRIVHAAWILLAIGALGIFVAALPAYALRAVGPQTETVYDAPPVLFRVISVLNMLASIAAAVTSLGLAFILFRRKPRDPMALYVSFYLLAYGVVMAGPMGVLEGARRMTESLTILTEAVLLTTPTITLFFIFPTGHFVPRWTRWVSVLSLVWIGVGFQLISNPPTAFDLRSLTGVLVSLLTWCVAAFYGLVYRYRRVSNLVEREQTKWVVLGLTGWFAYIAITMVPYLVTQAMPRDEPQPMWALVLGPTWWFSLNLLPLSLTIAVMRYRLFDIDLLINRALVYGTLTAITMGLYIVIVGFLANLFQATANAIFAFLATGLVAVLFQPLRERLQRGVNRLIYGDRDDPYAVLSRLGQRLEVSLAPDAVLPTIVETISQGLKLPCVAIALKEADKFKIVAAYPPTASPVSVKKEQPAKGNETAGETLPLVYQGETIGRLIFAPRAPGEPFTPTERRLLENITHQAGIAAHAVRLTVDLQRSRGRLVTTREEERRRLRRDLHDELGPTLASQALKLDAALEMLGDDQSQVGALLVDLKKQTQGIVADIRRLVYELRPPALDELGLVSALRAHVGQYSGSTNGLHISIEAPSDGLPPLSAAVEVAAYRIALEATTNAVRHAHAHECTVHLSVTNNRALQLEIRDDGAGMPRERIAGVGLNSMRERAEELGGTLILESSPTHGTRVLARLPRLKDE
ncbi:MAG: sensor histidine kinase [Chloroflexi bacterium]|nr:sensor histidine kinase [Chloroflexota bacterium]